MSHWKRCFGGVLRSQLFDQASMFQKDSKGFKRHFRALNQPSFSDGSNPTSQFGFLALEDCFQLLLKFFCDKMPELKITVPTSNTCKLQIDIFEHLIVPNSHGHLSPVIWFRIIPLPSLRTWTCTAGRSLHRYWFDFEPRSEIPAGPQPSSPFQMVSWYRLQCSFSLPGQSFDGAYFERCLTICPSAWSSALKACQSSGSWPTSGELDWNLTSNWQLSCQFKVVCFLFQITLKPTNQNDNLLCLEEHGMQTPWDTICAPNIVHFSSPFLLPKPVPLDTEGCTNNVCTWIHL